MRQRSRISFGSAGRSLEMPAVYWIPQKQALPGKCGDRIADPRIFIRVSFCNILRNLPRSWRQQSHDLLRASSGTVADRCCLHCCPICGKAHYVNSIRHDMAHGRPITCGFACEMQRRKKWKHQDYKALQAGQPGWQSQYSTIDPRRSSQAAMEDNDEKNCFCSMSADDYEGQRAE